MRHEQDWVSLFEREQTMVETKHLLPGNELPHDGICLCTCFLPQLVLHSPHIPNLCQAHGMALPSAKQATFLSGPGNPLSRQLHGLTDTRREMAPLAPSCPRIAAGPEGALSNSSNPGPCQRWNTRPDAWLTSWLFCRF